MELGGGPHPGRRSKPHRPGGPDPRLGENLHTATSVTFGGVGAATSVITVSNNVLTVVAPEHPPLPPGICTDTVDVQVTTAGGTSPLSDSRGQYTFCAAPVVTDMRPSSASVTSEFTLGGTCLQGATRVTFAPTAGGPATQADYHALSSSSLLVIVPPHLSEGTYDVQVTGPGGRSPLGPRTVFTV
ncbi:IPT/TIG domain-containing protein [Streptomyces sp. NPDC007083]|uniref:IPT/TIG domain-containing protein n=1 Tax=Streptomyces sp. NPDC007083 TaxID=3156913 RepID=UPI00340F294E